MGRLTLLRECQLNKLLKEEAKNELELSFKSAFRKKCQEADHPVVDSWKDCENPEETRQDYEGDLVLNQVWVDSAKKAREAKKVREFSDEDPLSARSDSTRASSTDVATSWSLGAVSKSMDVGQVHAQKSSPMLSHTEVRAARRRARSQGSLTLEKARLPGEVASRSRRS